MTINIKKVIFASQKRAGQATASTSTNDLLYLLSVVERGDQNSVITVDNTADFSSLVGQDSQIYYNKEDKKMYFVKNNTFFQTNGTTFYPLTGETSDPTDATWRSTYAPASYVYDTTPGFEGIRVNANDPITNMNRMFRSKATFNNSDVASWDVSTVTDMTEMFNGAIAFNQDVSSWDVSNVASMNIMFQSTNAFNQDISSWNMTSVTNMQGMFNFAIAFNNGGVALNGNFASTVGNVTNMQEVFRYAGAFNQDISSWNTSSVTNMIQMFDNATAFDQNLNGWDVSLIPSLPTNFATGATLFTTDEHPIWGTDGTIFYPLTGETTDPTNATWRSTYAPATYVYDTTPSAEGIRVKANDPITDMTSMFEGANSFSNSDIATWDVSTVTTMNSTFKNASKFGTEAVVKHTLDNPNAYGTSAADYFGWSVATSSTYNIVGAPYEDDASGLNSGKAYIYNNATGALLHTLDNPNAYDTSTNDEFGYNVAISDTYAIVGAFKEDDAGGTESGKAYIFNTVTGALVHTLDNPNAYGTSADDRFGYSVAISDTYAIVGAYYEDDAGGTESGKAYIYNNSTGALLHTLDNPNAYGTSLNDHFGISVSITDTYTIVGARFEDDAGGTQSGKAYIFNTVTGALLHTLDNPNAYDTSVNDYFGNSVGISDTYAIVSALNEDDAGGTQSGKAYIYNNATGALLHTLDNPNPDGAAAGDQFGYSVAITDTYTIVGVWNEGSSSQSGKAYIYNTATGALVHTLDNPNAYGTSLSDNFGYSVGITDAYAIVGARLEDDAGGTESGKAYIYDLYGPSSWNISGWNTGAVTDMTSMFNGATAFDQNLNNWDVTNIPSLPTNFATGATLFTTDEHPIWSTSGGILYPLSNTATDPTNTTWRTANPTYQFYPNVGILMPTGSPITSMFEMFNGSTINDPDISTWDVSTVTDMQYMFQNATSFNQDLSSWDVSNVTNMLYLFYGTTVFNQDISSWNVSNVTDMNSMFWSASAYNNGGATFVGSTFVSTMGGVTDMRSMFYQASAFNADISTWNVSSVTLMGYMFYGTTVFNQDLSSWNVSNVSQMINMFQNATAFDQNLNAWDVTNIPSIPTDFATGATLFTVAEHPIWGTTGGILYPLTNTATDFTSTQWRGAYGTAAGYSFIANLGILMPAGSPLTEMYYIFEGSSINDPDISTWDVSNVTNMQNAFANTTTFNQDISSWDVSSVLFMTDMFGGSVFNNGGVALSGNFASTMTSVTHMNAMFRNGPFNQDISSWNVSSVTIMDQMFQGASSFNQNISSWDVSSVTTMRYMFNQATAFNQPIGSWDPAITDMTGMFANASAFDQNLNAWDVSLIPSIPFQFAVNATLFTTNEHPIWGTSGSILYPLSNTATDPTSTQWRTNYGTAAGYQFVANLGILMPNGSPLTSMFGMFNVGSSDAPQGFNDPDISLWDVSNVTNMFAAFNGQTSFNQNLNSWNTSSVTNMNFTFGGNTVYNQPMNNWDLSAASITSYMFSSCTNFNGNLNGTFGSTIGLVSAGRPTNSTYNMFQFATAFNQPIGSWNTDAFNFTSDMFRDATAFDQDISGWNTSIVTNMSRMFWNALSFNQNISSWNTSSVTLMDQMFENANQFNQNISSWNVINVTSATDFSLNAAQKGTQANNWQSGEHPSNGTLGNFYNL